MTKPFAYSVPAFARRLGRWAVVVVLPLAFAALPTAARADNIDLQLNKKAPNLLKILSNKYHVKNVGVLKFQVVKEGPKNGFSTTQLGGNLATRLENALIIHNNEDESQAIGIIRDAGLVAAARKLSVSDRAKLFTITDYPLAWGNHKVKADAFLTGVVKVAPDLAKTRVQIYLVTAKEPSKLQEIANFAVDTDRSILHDLGETFAVARSLRKRSGSDLDKYAVVDANSRDNGQPTSEIKDPNDVFGFQLKILYDGVEQPITRDSMSSGEWRVTPPRAGQKVLIRLIPNINEKMGVVLKVNGESTLERQKEEPIKCSRWILDSRYNGTNQDHEGYYSYGGDQKLTPFRVLTPEESISREGDFDERYVGTIRLDVFVEGGGGTTPSSEEMLVSLRGLSRAALKRSPPQSLQDLQKRTLKAAGLKRKRGEGGLIVADGGDISTPDVKTVPFNNPRYLGGIQIRYYDAQKAVMNYTSN